MAACAVMCNRVYVCVCVYVFMNVFLYGCLSLSLSVLNW
jgi:hypothetical protein